MTTLSEKKRAEIRALIGREVVPAIGCTEPVAVALCTARACENLGAEPEKIVVRLSHNVLKNAMGVGIPGTGMTGLPIAIALGALIGKSSYGLEVLKDCTPEAVERGKKFIAEGRIIIELKEDAPDKLYIEVEARKGCCKAGQAIIMGGHTNFVPEGCASKCKAVREDKVELSMRTVWEYATESPIDELRHILEAARLNKAVAEHSLSTDYGHCVGRTMQQPSSLKLVGDGILSKLLMVTGAACDARMAGAMNPVMSNSGSGNQGITATLPVVTFAEQVGASEEQLVRALTLSHLTAIYIKQHLGRLSALCGCVVAATGSSCGIVYLMGGGYEQASCTVKYMVANITGMICDGAKPSCALKISTGVSTALLSAMMSMNHHRVNSLEGIISDDVDRTIANLALIGREGMNETDSLILKIMTGFRE